MSGAAPRSPSRMPNTPRPAIAMFSPVARPVPPREHRACRRPEPDTMLNQAVGTRRYRRRTPTGHRGQHDRDVEPEPVGGRASRRGRSSTARPRRRRRYRAVAGHRACALGAAGAGWRSEGRSIIRPIVGAELAGSVDREHPSPGPAVARISLRMAARQPGPLETAAFTNRRR